MSKISLSILVCIFCLGGCSQPEQVVSSDPVCLDFTMNQTMEAAKAALIQMHFNLEKDDPQTHYLRTRPLPGAQFFQFWRKDNADAYSAAQANMHSLRRIVEMEFSEKDNAVCIACRVQVQRLSFPEKPIEGRNASASAFTESQYNRQSVLVDEDQLAKMEWLDAGPDRALEQRILERVKKQLQEGKQR